MGDNLRISIESRAPCGESQRIYRNDMKIGKETIPRSAICTSNADTIVVRGKDLAKELIGQISFTDYFYLLVTGERPSQPASVVLDATLIAIAEHGLVPSVQASRMTLAAAPDALQGAVAARSEEHTSELQSREKLVCRLLLEKKKYQIED